MAAPLQIECHGKSIAVSRSLNVFSVVSHVDPINAGKNYMHRLPPMQPLQNLIKPILEQVS